MPDSTNPVVPASQAAAPPAPLAAEPGSLLQAIVGMARDPSVDVAKLDGLMRMQERLEERQAEREFAAAFARLSGDLPRVKKNGTITLGAGKGEIPFARWEDIDQVIRPLLFREGFTLSFDSAPRDGGGLVVTGRLMHRDGHSRTASMPLPIDTGPGRNNLQAMGSTLSYGRRYCAEMLLNIVREGEDDDGKRHGERFVTDDEAAELRDLITESGADTAAFLRHFEARSVGELRADDYAPAKNMLLQKQQRRRERATA